MCKLLKIITIVVGLAFIALPAHAYEKGDWVLRGGVGAVDPKSKSYSDDTLIVKVDTGTSAVFSLTYMFSPNFGFDVLASWPFSHDINVEDPLGQAVGGKLAETKHLPPTFSLQYHFIPGGNFMPYVGLGVNYTTFFDEKVTADPDLALSLDDSFGLAAQVGADMKIGDRWVVNFDLRYINIETDATLTDTKTPTVSPPIKVEINPIVYSLNIGYIF